jgi:hypothetical protein
MHPLHWYARQGIIVHRASSCQLSRQQIQVILLIGQEDPALNSTGFKEVMTQNSYIPGMPGHKCFHSAILLKP